MKFASKIWISNFTSMRSAVQLRLELARDLTENTREILKSLDVSLLFDPGPSAIRYGRQSSSQTSD